MSKRSWGTLLLTLVCIMTFAVFSGAAFAAEGETVVRVGWYDTGIGEDGHGYDYEYLQALSQYTGWTYEYVDGTWEECLQRLEDGEIDLLSFVQEMPEREGIYGYPSLPMAITSGFLVTDKDSELQISNPALLNGIEVGIVKGNNYNVDFAKYRLENDLEVTYREYDTLSEIAPALKAGEIDAAVVAE